MKQPTRAEIALDLATQLDDLLDDITKFQKKLKDLIIDLEDLARMIQSAEELNQ